MLITTDMGTCNNTVCDYLGWLNSSMGYGLGNISAIYTNVSKITGDI
jgi:hypothetical protein